MHFLKKYAWIVLIAFLGISFVANQMAVKGAQSGGTKIKKMSTLRANLNPQEYYWEVYPYSLLICMGIALLIIIIGCIISSILRQESKV